MRCVVLLRHDKHDQRRPARKWMVPASVPCFLIILLPRIPSTLVFIQHGVYDVQAQIRVKYRTPVSILSGPLTVVVQRTESHVVNRQPNRATPVILILTKERMGLTQTSKTIGRPQRVVVAQQVQRRT